MSETRPWVLFLSVLAFIGGGLMALGSVTLGIMVVLEEEPLAIILALIYLIYGGFGLGCAYYLFSYGQRIGVFLSTSHNDHLETALVAQKSFWKLVGIFAVVVLLVTLLGGLLVAIIPLVMMGM
jgi:hypothetical protein